VLVIHFFFNDFEKFGYFRCYVGIVSECAQHQLSQEEKLELCPGDVERELKKLHGHNHDGFHFVIPPAVSSSSLNDLCIIIVSSS
jgi:hypothetical protein